MMGIVILNYKNWDETVKCVQSILKYPPKLGNPKIYIVDNGSPNKPNKEFYELIDRPNIKFVISERNGGYAYGNNIGIKMAINDNCDIIIISNSDIYYLKNSLNEFEKFYKNNKGICFPKIYDLEGNITPVYKSYLKNVKQIFAQVLPKNKISQKYLDKIIGKLDVNTNKCVQTHLNLGPCFAIDYNSAKILTPLDEHTILYYEEYILSRNADKFGIDIYYCPKSVVVHGEGRSTGGPTPFSLMCFHESTIYYCRHILNKNKIFIFPLKFYLDIRYWLHGIKNEDFKISRKEYKYRINKMWR